MEFCYLACRKNFLNSANVLKLPYFLYRYVIEYKVFLVKIDMGMQLSIKCLSVKIGPLPIKFCSIILVRPARCEGVFTAAGIGQRHRNCTFFMML